MGSLQTSPTLPFNSHFWHLHNYSHEVNRATEHQKRFRFLSPRQRGNKRRFRKDSFMWSFCFLLWIFLSPTLKMRLWDKSMHNENHEWTGCSDPISLILAQTQETLILLDMKTHSDTNTLAAFWTCSSQKDGMCPGVLFMFPQLGKINHVFAYILYKKIRHYILHFSPPQWENYIGSPLLPIIEPLF